MKDQQDYVGQIAYEIQKWKMHEALEEEGYYLNEDDEDMVIEYASAWSIDVTDVALEFEFGNLRKISFDDYVEEYVVEDYACRAGEEGVEILREFQRWLPTDDFKEFVRDHFTDGAEDIVENFEDDYIIIMIR